MGATWCCLFLTKDGLGFAVPQVLTIGGLNTGTQAMAIKKGCHMVVAAWLLMHAHAYVHIGFYTHTHAYNYIPYIIIYCL